MVNICQQCGDRGFPEALINCEKCKTTAVHLYCLPVLPESFEEDVIWYCEDCEPKVAKKTTIDNCRSLLATKFDSENLEVVHPARSSSRLKRNARHRLKKKMKKKKHKSGEASGLLAQAAVQKYEKSSSHLASGDSESNLEYSCELHYGDSDKNNEKLGREIVWDGSSSDEDVELYEDGELFKTRTSRVVTNDPLNTPECSSNAHKKLIHEVYCSGNSKLRKQRELVRNSSDADTESVKTSPVATDNPLSILKYSSDIHAHLSIEEQCNENYENDQRLIRWKATDGDSYTEEAASVKIGTSLVDTSEPSNIPKHRCYIPAQPIIEPIWKGSMHLSNYKYRTIGGLVAHLSTLACSKVFQEANLLPELLSPDLCLRFHVWPKSFHKGGPSDKNIGLYLFPNNERDEKVYDRLVDDMVSRDLAMRAVVKNAELLLFTSKLLPFQFWRFQAKFYLWGVFRGKQASQSRPLALQTINAITLLEPKEPPYALTWHIQSPVSPLSNSGSHGSGSV